MTDQSDPDQPGLPALSDDEQRKTLDLMATANASMSNRIDDLTTVADKQFKVATEARIAAFAAREQKVDRFKSRLPWLGPGPIVLALAMTVPFPCLLANYPSTCAVLGVS